MPFIGIITDENKENSIDVKITEKLKLKDNEVLFIKESTIDNIKNIKFETILLDRNFKNVEVLNKILRNTKYLIINTDNVNNLKLLKDLELTVITYGFNTKATITASSVNEEEVLVCLQRSITDIKGNNIEPQEIKVKLEKDANCTMAIEAILLIYGK